MVFVDVPLRNCLNARGVWIISDLKAESYLDAFKREPLQSGLELLGIMGTFSVLSEMITFCKTLSVTWVFWVHFGMYALIFLGTCWYFLYIVVYLGILRYF